MSHTIGSHSDDRGGESDFPCDCEDRLTKGNDMTTEGSQSQGKGHLESPEAAWINTLLHQYGRWIASENPHDPNLLTFTEAREAILTKLIEARLDQTLHGKYTVESMDPDCNSLQSFDYEIERLKASKENV